MISATVLVDGTVRGSWQLRFSSEKATLTVEPFEILSTVDREAVEATRLLAFAAPELGQELVWM
jgi:hypothetical protein